MDATEAQWVGNREQWARVAVLGRRLALDVGCEPDDGAQEARLIVCEILNEKATRARPLTELAMLGRVHDRLLGRNSVTVDSTGRSHGTCRGRLDRNQTLYWRGQCSGGGYAGAGLDDGPAQLSAGCVP
jgi:hypothetical protein